MAFHYRHIAFRFFQFLLLPLWLLMAVFSEVRLQVSLHDRDVSQREDPSPPVLAVYRKITSLEWAGKGDRKTADSIRNFQLILFNIVAVDHGSESNHHTKFIRNLVPKSIHGQCQSICLKSKLWLFLSSWWLARLSVQIINTGRIHLRLVLGSCLEGAEKPLSWMHFMFQLVTEPALSMVNQINRSS